MINCFKKDANLDETLLSFPGFYIFPFQGKFSFLCKYRFNKFSFVWPDSHKRHFAAHYIIMCIAVYMANTS